MQALTPKACRWPVALRHMALLTCCSCLVTGLPDRGMAGTTYYVAAAGSDTDPGTIQRPLQSVIKAVSRLQPGDTLMFRAGRYPPFEVRNLNGTSNAWITFKAHPGERVTIDRHLDQRKDVVSCIHIVGRCSYLIFEGLEITNSNPLIDQLRALDMSKPEDVAHWLPYTERSEGRAVLGSGVRINPPSTPPHHQQLIFRNLEIHHLLGMGFSGAGDDIQFLDNRVYDLGRPRSGYGWYTSGDRHVYRGNIVHDNTYGFHLYSEGGKRPLRDSVVENNFVYNNGGDPYFHMSSRKVHRAGVGLLIVPGDNNIVRNNLVVNNAGGIRIASNNTSIVHNTVYGNGLYGISSNAANTVIKNNIVYKTGGSVPDLEGPGNLVSDPGFRDPAVFDFHLRPGSRAIGAGEPFAEAKVAADLDGLARPPDSAPDMGAYAFAVEPAFRFSLAAGQDLSVTPAGSVSTTITATPLSGTTQPISIVVLGLPRDTGISFVTKSGTPPGTMLLTLTPTTLARAGTHRVTVAASGGGATQCCHFSLTIRD